MHDRPRRVRALTTAIAALAVLAIAPAAGAAERTVEMNGSNTEEWSGTGPGVGAGTGDLGIPCATPLSGCDETLVKLGKPGGQLNLEVTMTSPADDWDVYLYVSDESGAEGEPVPYTNDFVGVTESAAIPEATEQYYLIRISGYIGLAGFSAKLGYTNPVVPSSKIGKLAKKVKSSKLKKISGTAASEGGTVSQVEVAIVKAADCPSTCEPTNWVAATGTSKWTLKLKKKLKKGKYVVLSRATDESGVQETEFSAEKGNRKELTVR